MRKKLEQKVAREKPPVFLAQVRRPNGNLALLEATHLSVAKILQGATRIPSDLRHPELVILPAGKYLGNTRKIDDENTVLEGVKGQDRYDNFVFSSSRNSDGNFEVDVRDETLRPLLIGEEEIALADKSYGKNALARALKRCPGATNATVIKTANEDGLTDQVLVLWRGRKKEPLVCEHTLFYPGTAIVETDHASYYGDEDLIAARHSKGDSRRYQLSHYLLPPRESAVLRWIYSQNADLYDLKKLARDVVLKGGRAEICQWLSRAGRYVRNFPWNSQIASRADEETPTISDMAFGFLPALLKHQAVLRTALPKKAVDSLIKTFRGLETAPESPTEMRGSAPAKHAALERKAGIR